MPQVDVLSEENADSYWQRSDQFDMGLDLTAETGAGRACGSHDALDFSSARDRCQRSSRSRELRDAKLTWYMGLDSEATRIGDRLWHGETLDDRTAGRVLALFRLSFADPALAC